MSIPTLPKTLFIIVNHIEIKEVEMVGFTNNKLTGLITWFVKWEEDDQIIKKEMYPSQVATSKEGIIEQLKKFNDIQL